MEEAQVAAGHQRQADLPVRRNPRPDRPGPQTPDGRRSRAGHAGDEEVWLIGERRATGERKYYASNLPADTSLKALAAAVKARWIYEQAHQQLKEELGLDRFEGRSWTSLHRHALMTMIAYAFVQSRRLKAAGREKKSPRTTPATDHASRQASHPRRIRETPTNTMPSL